MANDVVVSGIRIALLSVNILGIIGNIISFIVYCRSVFRKNSISVYCCALAIFDCFTINELYMDINMVFFDYFPPFYSDLSCKMYYYVITAFSGIPAWILVSFSMDKMLSMKNSNRFKFIKKRSFQLGIIAVIAIANLLIFSEILIYLVRTAVTKDYIYCDLSRMPYITIVVLVYLLVASIIPFIIMIVTSVSMVRLLAQSRRKTIGVGNNILVQRRKNRDFKFAFTSLTFNFLFITLKLPLVLYYILNGAGIIMPYYYIYFALLLFYVNSSISFLVHLVSNSLFRKELGIILRIHFYIPFFHTRTSTRVLTIPQLQSTE